MLKLNIDGDDLDQLATIHAPHLVPHLTGAALLMRPGGGDMPAPPEISAPWSEQTPISRSPTPGPGVPSRKDSIAAGKQEFKAGMPQLTEDPGTSGYFQKQMEIADYKKEHPWGSPISEQPGFLGKLGHIAGRVGNIAGDILAPATTALIPGSDLNNQIERSREQRGFEKATQEETQKEGVEQRPEIAEMQGELKERLASDKAKEAEKLLQERTEAQNAHDDKRAEEAQTRLEALFKHGDERQAATFKEQEKLAGQREAGQNERLDKTLKQREEGAGRKEVATHDRAYVQPAEAIERSYQLYKEAQKAFESGNAKTGAASMLALSQHLATTFGQVKGSRMNKDLIQEHKDAIGVEDRIERFVEHLKTGQELAPNQIKEFGDLIKNMRDLTWQITKKEGDRKKVPQDYLPEDLAGAASTSGAPKTGGNTVTLDQFLKEPH